MLLRYSEFVTLIKVPIIMKRKCLLLVVAVASMNTTASHAQTPAAFDRCHNQNSTAEIVDCLGKLTQEADRRLNAAYQKALKSEEPSGVPALRAAERAWLEYRKQRCFYLTAGEGTIMQVVGADCMATMTKARADELEGDSRGLGPG